MASGFVPFRTKHRPLAQSAKARGVPLRLEFELPCRSEVVSRKKANARSSSPAIGVQQRPATSAGDEFKDENHGGRFHANLATKCLVPL
jgi:hypothetical protein